jgi:hypothetical protein
MTIESLMQTCAELGIKLALKGDYSDRLQVDAPKGALTPELREALTSQKPAVIAFLKEQESRQAQGPTFDHDPEVTETRAPASTQWNSPEATPLIREQSVTHTPAPLGHTDAEVNKLLSGRPYNPSVIDAKDLAARQAISAQLLSALAGRNSEQQMYARRGFMDHGYFDDAVQQLRTADSPAERAAAARKLGVVGDSSATVHLTESLRDGAPEVRRAAAESLGQIGDPTAIPPLNELLLRETSRQLPAAVIRHAINSITVTAARRPPSEPLREAPREALRETGVLRVVEPQIVKPEPPAARVLEMPVVQRETPPAKREIFADYLSAVEPRTPVTGTAGTGTAGVPPASRPITPRSFDAAEEQLRIEEEALRKAADALDK